MRAQPNRDYNSNDCVDTPSWLAFELVYHFKPYGRVLEPCRGSGTFFRELEAYPDVTKLDWDEIEAGRDFLSRADDQAFDWIITNPPWSKIQSFLRKSMAVADNVVLLTTTNHLFTKCRRRLIRDAGFGIKEIAYVRWPDEWHSSGFTLSANHFQRGWTSGITETDLGGLG